MTDPRAPNLAGESIRTVWLAALLMALLPAAASALPPHEPQAQERYFQLVQAEAPAPGEQTVEDLNAALSEIKRRLAEQRNALTAGDQAKEIAEEAKAARMQIERLTRSMVDLRRERDALRGQLVSTRDSADALQAKLHETEARVRDAQDGTVERLQAMQQEVDQAKAAQTAVEVQLADAQQQLAGEAGARQGLATAAEQLKRQVDEAAAALAAKDRDLGLAGAQLAEQKTEAARLDQELAVARSLGARLTDEVTRTRHALGAANAHSTEIAKEVEGLRAVAAASVDEVRSLGEQLMAALADNRQLAAALSDIRAGTDLLDSQLDGAATPASAPIPGAGEAAGGEAVLARLSSSDDAAPAAGPVEARLGTGTDGAAVDKGASGTRRQWAMTTIDSSAFASGSADLRSEATPSLAIVAAFIRSQPPGWVRITGFTDSVGDDSANLALSKHRAEVVREYLVRNYNLTPERLIAEGRGEAEPVASNSTENGRRSNRRLEIRIEP